MQLKAFLLETAALLRTISWHRLLNAMQLTYSYLYSYKNKKASLKGYPMAFAIEPTSICNLKCPECPTGANLLKRPRGMIDFEHYQQVLKQLTDKLIYLNLYIQGEPLMHPEFGKMVLEAKKYRLFTSTSTNGHYMNPAIAKQLVDGKLTRLIFSVDGTNQESYGLYRVGGDFEKVKKSINQIVQAKKEAKSNYPIVVMQFIVFRHNEHELPIVRKLARSLNVDKLEIKTAQLNSFGNKRPPLNIRFSRYADAIGKVMKRKTLNRCWKQWHSGTITWDGNFAPCCYDKDAQFSFGNTHNDTVQNIWHNNKSLSFKNKILTDRNSIDMCNNCPEGHSLF